MSIWKGDKIRLRSIEPSDWETFHALSEDTETARFYDKILIPTSKEKMKKWCEEMAIASHDNDEIVLVIETLDGQMAGLMDIFDCDRRYGIFKYGIGIHKNFQRKGYASMAVRLLLRYYFLELRYQKVNVHIYSFNEPSIELHRRLGFVQEGCLRNMAFTKGKFHDELVFGLLSSEFENLHPPKSMQ